MWAETATLLADRFTVVVVDLPGCGRSFRPAPVTDHTPHSKRALAEDFAQVMSGLGHERFSVTGHDRGGRVAYRMALDHPDRVAALSVLDVVPTGDVWGRADADLALLYWHSAFLAQPAPLPERLIAADPDAFFEFHVRTLSADEARHLEVFSRRATLRDRPLGGSGAGGRASLQPATPCSPSSPTGYSPSSPGRAPSIHHLFGPKPSN